MAHVPLTQPDWSFKAKDDICQSVSLAEFQQRGRTHRQGESVLVNMAEAGLVDISKPLVSAELMLYHRDCLGTPKTHKATQPYKTQLYLTEWELRTESKAGKTNSKERLKHRPTASLTASTNIERDMRCSWQSQGLPKRRKKERQRLRRGSWSQLNLAAA